MECFWCVNDETTNASVLEKFCSADITVELQFEMKKDMLDCYDCVLAYHAAKTYFLEQQQSARNELNSWEVERLSQHIKSVLNPEKSDDGDSEIENCFQDDAAFFLGFGFGDGSLLTRKLTIPLQEILQFPYLLWNKELESLAVKALLSLEEAGSPLILNSKLPGIYLLLVHPSSQVRKWARKSVNYLGSISCDDYDDLSDVLKWVLGVSEFGLFQCPELCENAMDQNTYTILPSHLFLQRSVKEFWLGVCMFLKALKATTVRLQLVSRDNHQAFIGVVVNALDSSNAVDVKKAHGSESEFWPVLHCFIILTERLGSRIWQHVTLPDAQMKVFQMVTKHPAYQHELQLWPGFAAEGEPQTSSTSGEEECSSQISASQMVYGWDGQGRRAPNRSRSSSENMSHAFTSKGKRQKVAFAWFKPYITSVMDFGHVGSTVVKTVLKYLHELKLSYQVASEGYDNSIAALVVCLDQLFKSSLHSMLTIASDLWITDLIDILKLKAEKPTRAQKLAKAFCQSILERMAKKGTNVAPLLQWISDENSLTNTNDEMLSRLENLFRKYFKSETTSPPSSRIFDRELRVIIQSPKQSRSSSDDAPKNKNGSTCVTSPPKVKQEYKFLMTKKTPQLNLSTLKAGQKRRLPPTQVEPKSEIKTTQVEPKSGIKLTQVEAKPEINTTQVEPKPEITCLKTEEKTIKDYFEKSSLLEPRIHIEKLKITKNVADVIVLSESDDFMPVPVKKPTSITAMLATKRKKSTRARSKGQGEVSSTNTSPVPDKNIALKNFCGGLSPSSTVKKPDPIKLLDDHSEDDFLATLCSQLETKYTPPTLTKKSAAKKEALKEPRPKKKKLEKRKTKYNDTVVINNENFIVISDDSCSDNDDLTKKGLEATLDVKPPKLDLDAIVESSKDSWLVLNNVKGFVGEDKIRVESVKLEQHNDITSTVPDIKPNMTEYDKDIKVLLEDIKPETYRSVASNEEEETEDADRKSPLHERVFNNNEDWDITWGDTNEDDMLMSCLDIRDSMDTMTCVEADLDDLSDESDSWDIMVLSDNEEKPTRCDDAGDYSRHYTIKSEPMTVKSEPMMNSYEFLTSPARDVPKPFDDVIIKTETVATKSEGYLDESTGLDDDKTVKSEAVRIDNVGKFEDESPYSSSPEVSNTKCFGDLFSKLKSKFNKPCLKPPVNYVKHSVTQLKKEENEEPDEKILNELNESSATHTVKQTKKERNDKSGEKVLGKHYGSSGTRTVLKPSINYVEHTAKQPKEEENDKADEKALRELNGSSAIHTVLKPRTDYVKHTVKQKPKEEENDKRGKAITEREVGKERETISKEPNEVATASEEANTVSDMVSTGPEKAPEASDGIGTGLQKSPEGSDMVNTEPGPDKLSTEPNRVAEETEKASTASDVSKNGDQQLESVKTTKTITEMNTAENDDMDISDTSVSSPEDATAQPLDNIIDSTEADLHRPWSLAKPPVLNRSQSTHPKPPVAATRDVRANSFPGTKVPSAPTPLAERQPSTVQRRPVEVVTKPKRPISVEEFYFRILKWDADLLHEKPIKSPPINDHGKVCRTFDHMDNYYKIFKPLVFLELWAQVVREWKETLSKSTQRTYSLIVDSVNRFVVDFQLIKCKRRIRFDNNIAEYFLHEHDLVTIQVKDEPSLPPTQLFAIVDSINRERCRGQFRDEEGGDYWEFTVTLRLLQNVRSPMVRGTLDCMFVTSLVASYRQWNGLKFLPRSLLARDILCPRLASCKTNEVNKEQSKESGLFNASQLAAIERTCEALRKPYPIPKICFIQGPPGTGKSHTIIGLIKKHLKNRSVELESERENQLPGSSTSKYFNQSSGRVLLCAPSNAAVDVLVRRLVADIKANKDEFGSGDGKNCGSVNIVRVGRFTSVHRQVQPFTLDVLKKTEVVKLAAKDIKAGEVVKAELDDLRQHLDKLEKTLYGLRCSGHDPEGDEVKNVNLKIEKLTRKKKPIEIQYSQIRERAKTRKRQEEKIKKNILLSADIICSTLNGSGCSLLSTELLQNNRMHLPFSCIIVDEACQSCELDLLIPLQFGPSKLVLVGDPEQLPTTVLSQKAQELLLGQSLYERHYRVFRERAHKIGLSLHATKDNPIQMLDVQYRMHPDIATFPSAHVYHGRLNNARSVVTRSTISPLKPYVMLNVCNGKERPSPNGSVCNPLESDFVVEICSLLRTSLQERHIGIITPYRAQVNLLEKRFRERSIDKIEVNTVDGFQGREKEVIIMSCVRANGLSRGIGFLADRQRMNVALTRGRYSLVILLHSESLVTNKDWKACIDDARRRGFFHDVYNTTDLKIAFHNGPFKALESPTRKTPEKGGMLTPVDGQEQKPEHKPSENKETAKNCGPVDPRRLAARIQSTTSSSLKGLEKNQDKNKKNPGNDAQRTKAPGDKGTSGDSLKNNLGILGGVKTKLPGSHTSSSKTSQGKRSGANHPSSKPSNRTLPALMTSGKQFPSATNVSRKKTLVKLVPGKQPDREHHVDRNSPGLPDNQSSKKRKEKRERKLSKSYNSGTSGILKDHRAKIPRAERDSKKRPAEEDDKNRKRQRTENPEAHASNVLTPIDSGPKVRFSFPPGNTSPKPVEQVPRGFDEPVLSQTSCDFDFDEFEPKETISAAPVENSTNDQAALRTGFQGNAHDSLVNDDVVDRVVHSGGMLLAQNNPYLKQLMEVERREDHARNTRSPLPAMPTERAEHAWRHPPVVQKQYFTHSPPVSLPRSTPFVNRAQSGSDAFDLRKVIENVEQHHPKRQPTPLLNQKDSLESFTRYFGGHRARVAHSSTRYHTDTGTRNYMAGHIAETMHPGGQRKQPNNMDKIKSTWKKNK